MQAWLPSRLPAYNANLQTRTPISQSQIRINRIQSQQKHSLVYALNLNLARMSKDFELQQ